MFLHLLEKENWERIQIDERLKGPFKNMLMRMERYFEAKGYGDVKDYEDFFEKCLLLPKESDSVTHDKVGYFRDGVWSKGFTIEANAEPQEEKANGFYSNDRICINDKRLEASEEELEGTLCHEFIHFLINHDLDKTKADENICFGGFIEEALTEMLKQEIYPRSNLQYVPQVKMIQFANMLTGNVNNYRKFLQGNIDFKADAEVYVWNNFLTYVNKYQEGDAKKGFTMYNAIQNDNYTEAQRYLIKHSMHLKMRAEDFKIEEYLRSLYRGY